MTDRSIAARLARLRAAGARLRRRSARQTQEALARVFELWSDASSAPRRALARELPEATGFSAPVVAEGLRLGLREWTGEAFCELARRELGAPESLDAAHGRAVCGFETTAVLLAGSIPMPTLLAIAAPLALRSPTLAKVASRDPVTARHVAHSIAVCDEELGHCVDWVEFPGDDADRVDALLAADCVVASGSDETMSAVAARIDPRQRLVAYGHRLSVAVVRGAAEYTAGRLALDVALWDQLGCLSPIAVYVIDPGRSAADAFAEALAQSLSDIEARLPRGRVAVDSAARISHERASAELRASAGARVAVHGAADGTWTVVREDSAATRDAPLHRFVRVLPVSDGAALIDALTPLAPHLASAGVEGVDAQLSRALVGLGVSRVCALGTMQCPPIAWRHDNRGVLEPLARFPDVDYVA